MAITPFWPNDTRIQFHQRRRPSPPQQMMIKLAKLMKLIVKDNLMKVGCHKIHRWPFMAWLVCLLNEIIIPILVSSFCYLQQQL